MPDYAVAGYPVSKWQKILKFSPNSPRLTTGGGYSPSCVSASGQMTRPRGTPVCFFMSGVSGTVYIVDRMKLGAENNRNTPIPILTELLDEKDFPLSK